MKAARAPRSSPARRSKKQFKKHQGDLPCAGQEKKFGGHGLILDTAGNSRRATRKNVKEKVTPAPYGLLICCKKRFGKCWAPKVGQRGSEDITVERTRFDFAFPRKLTPEELKKVEDLVNEKIKEDLPVQFVEMPKEEAVKTGALFFFKEKYPEKVKVYFVGKDIASAWSKEFCGGPHVTHTGEVGHFRIAKERDGGRRH